MLKLRAWLLILAIVVVVSGLSAAQMSPSAGLAGKVTSNGKPLAGVVVSARADNKAFTTSVFTDQNGRYSFPELEGGHYAIWAQAVGFEGPKSEQTLASGKKTQQDFILKTLQDFSRQLSGDELMASLPGDSRDDLRMKTIFVNNCTGCHQANYPLQNRFDAVGWGTMVGLMSKAGANGIINPDNPGQPMIKAYKDQLVAYLAKVRGPNSAPLNYKVFPRPTGEAAQVVITEFDVPQATTPEEHFRHEGANWSEGEPSGHHSRAPHDAVVDQRGIVWFTDQESPTRTLGKLDPKTGESSSFVLAGKDGTSVHTHGLAVDQGGNVWISNGEEGTFSKFDPKTNEFTRFPKPESMSRVGGTVVVDVSGGIWAETNEGAIKLNPSTGEYSAYKASVPGGTYGMAVDKEGNAWFTQPGLEKISIIDKGGNVSELTLKPLQEDLANDADRQLATTLRSGANNGTPLLKAPRRLAGDMDGDYVWVAEYAANRLARINIHTKEIKEYPLPFEFGMPYATAVDRNHNVWISLMNADRVAKFDPSTEKFTAFMLPTRGTEARFIAVDNNTNPPSVWIPYYRTNKVARIQLLPSSSKMNVASLNK